MEIAIKTAQPILAMLLSPLLFGIINKIKAFFAGRKGLPLFQTYFDIWKLLHKGIVYSKTSSWIFKTSPIIGLAAIIIITFFVPMGHTKALISFGGDFIFVIYLFALMRFFIVIAALDTGSSFEGMGASREVQFSAMSEPALFLVLVTLVCVTGKFCLSEVLSAVTSEFWFSHLAVILFIGAALIIVLLAENARIPIDDPNTHLELTMIHEVMILDNSGPDLAFIILTSGLKLWIFSVLLVSVLIPDFGLAWPLNLLICISGVFVTAIVIGIIESCIARLSLLFVPHFIFAATVFAVLALIFVLGK